MTRRRMQRVRNEHSQSLPKNQYFQRAMHVMSSWLTMSSSEKNTCEQHGFNIAVLTWKVSVFDGAYHGEGGVVWRSRLRGDLVLGRFGRREHFVQHHDGVFYRNLKNYQSRSSQVVIWTLSRFSLKTHVVESILQGNDLNDWWMTKCTGESNH